MSPELGSLDDVLSDDELINALAERRLDDLHGGDGLAATLAAWCEDLDEEPSAASIPTADLADAAARRRTLRRTGRSLAAAAAVAVVCVGGLAVSRLAMSSSHDDRPATTDSAATASAQARQNIWAQLGEARTALMQKHWGQAEQLVAAARAQLPQVSQADGRAALGSWITLLEKAVQEHASLNSDAGPGPTQDTHEVAPRQLYNGGVPLPPGAATTSLPTESTLPALPTTLPSLQPSQPVGQPRSTAPGSREPGPTHGPSATPSHNPPASRPPGTKPSNEPTSPPASTVDPTPTLPLGPNSPPVPPRFLPLPSLGNGGDGTDPSATPSPSVSASPTAS
ncbi:MAG TPA: hypothetical protein VHX59_15400 [Mycobacteriales bacterium]|jgi:hypothetical protein|nr:hypothetical protein [Mycobacteriales bacterium]